MSEQGTAAEARAESTPTDEVHAAIGPVVVAGILLAFAVGFRLGVDALIQGRTGLTFIDPDVWPTWLLNVLIVLTAFHLVQEVRKRKALRSAATTANDARHRDASASALDDEEERADRRGVVTALALLVGYVALVTPIGFVPATVVFSIAFLLFLGERRWWLLLGFPVVVNAVLLAVFTRLLVIPLPRGLGPFVEFSAYLY